MSEIRDALDRAINWQPHLRIYCFLAKWGTEFEPMPRPKGVRLGAKKKCFSNAARVVQADDNEIASNPFEYAEGLTIGPEGRLFEHAWCVRDGFAIDPTLRDPMSHGYLGIVVPIQLLRRLQNVNEVYDVLTYQSGQDFMQRWDQVGGDIERLIELYSL